VVIEGDANCGKIYLKECTINNLSNVQGIFRYSGFNGEIGLCPSGELVASQCYSEIPGSASPVLSYSGNNQVSLRAYSGGLRLENMCVNCETTAEYIAGKLNFNDDDNQGGYLTVRGTVFVNRTGTPNPNVTIDTSATVTDLTLQDLSNVDLTGANITIDAPTAAEIVAEMDANSTQLAAILSDTNTIVLDTTTIITDIASIDLKVDDIKRDTGNISNIVSSMNSNVVTIINDVDTLNTNVITIDNAIGDLSNTVNLINANTSVNNTALSNIENTVIAIDSNVAVLDDKVDAVTLDIADLKADVANISFSGGLTPTQATMLLEMYELLGLDPTKPLVVTEVARTAGNISQTIDTNNTRTIVTRD
jgi:hypothetical protein